MAMFSSEKAHSITQVVMNLPNDATNYLGLSLSHGRIYFILIFPVKFTHYSGCILLK